MDIRFLKCFGFCCVCNEWIELLPGKDWLPEHENKDKDPCRGKGYSYWKLKYKVKSKRGAKKLAQMIADDDGNCLKSNRGHSLGCGDGENCAATRLSLAKALADYVLGQ
jgi:hypothetical protein